MEDNMKEQQTAVSSDSPDKEQQATKAKEEKRQHDMEVMAAWRSEKKAKRELRRTRRKARPLWRKILSGVLTAVAVIAVAVGAFYLFGGMNLIAELYNNYYFDNLYYVEQVDTEELREGCDIDEEAAAEVAAMPGYDADDTWAVYIYMVGSNLESCEEDDLSEMVRNMTESVAEANTANALQAKQEYIDSYISAIEDADMELPSPMYVIDSPTESSSTFVTTDVVKADMEGAAYEDIQEILRADISDNVDVVIQTGGAKRWSNAVINPNRIQRFHVEDGALVEEDNISIENMASTDTLADFLSYCEKNHDADHKIVIFWDHGGGSTGYGYDEIYGHQMSLKEMQKALAKVYGTNPKEAPFEIIGFDACLMSAAEALDSFENYGKYFVGSEETEPGCGWYYTRWLTNLSANPSMNGAQVGLNIVDDYMDFYRGVDIKLSSMVGKESVGLYVLDLKEAGKAYDEYENLVEQVLKDTQTDPEALTALSRAAHESIHYSAPYTEIYNTVDLGIMMDNISERYPEETRKIKDIINNAVLYGRAANNMVGSQGISIYYPDSVTSVNSVYYMMNYISTITDSDAIKALYFYKSAGCTTKEIQASLKSMGITNLKNIDTEALSVVSDSDPEINGEGRFTLNVDTSALKYIEDYKFALGYMDSYGGIIDYGQDCGQIMLDESGRLSASFDGKWPCIEGEPLSCKVIQQHDGIVTYQSSILLNGEDAYLVFTYDSASEEFSILGAYLETDAIEGDYIARNVSDLTVGAKITPVYDYNSVEDGLIVTEGDSVRYGKNTKISYSKLPDGDYFSAISFTDVRGDEFESKVIEFQENGGRISDTAISGNVVYLED